MRQKVCLQLGSRTRGVSGMHTWEVALCRLVEREPPCAHGLQVCGPVLAGPHGVQAAAGQGLAAQAGLLMPLLLCCEQTLVPPPRG